MPVPAPGPSCGGGGARLAVRRYRASKTAMVRTLAGSWAPATQLIAYSFRREQDLLTAGDISTGGALNSVVGCSLTVTDAAETRGATGFGRLTGHAASTMGLRHRSAGSLLARRSSRSLVAWDLAEGEYDRTTCSSLALPAAATPRLRPSRHLPGQPGNRSG